MRSAVWTVYDDAHQTVRTATGYATGSAPSYTFTLINPVEIREFDKSGKPIAVIRAVRASASGKLQPTDTFAQSSYVRWMTFQYTDCCLLASQRVYHTIPASGPGSSGTNYDETLLGYDVMKRRNRTQSPGGTISFSVADVRNLPIGQYVGTDDIGASWTDPTGGGALGNNMVQVSAGEYDNGDPGGDGNLTLSTAYVDASTTRVTSQTYDWRNRLLTVTAPESVFTESTYDNFDRVVTQQSRDTNASGTILSRIETFFDQRGRVYQTKSYGMNVTTALTSNAWFDAAGNTLKSLPAGSHLFTKVAYDSLNRVVTQSLGYDLTESSYSEAGSVSDDVLLEQTILTYDETSTVI
ncbi:MAG: RHS repeat-associated core domain-containing protein, partial [Planctomycetaceae bacterium]